MLSAAKHLYVNRAGPFATLRVTALKWQEHDRAKLSMDFVKTLAEQSNEVLGLRQVACDASNNGTYTPLHRIFRSSSISELKAFAIGDEFAFVAGHKPLEFIL